MTKQMPCFFYYLKAMFEISKTASFEVVMFRPAAVDVRPQVPRIVCETHTFVDHTLTCTHSHATSTAMSH